MVQHIIYTKSFKNTNKEYNHFSLDLLEIKTRKLLKWFKFFKDRLESRKKICS